MSLDFSTVAATSHKLVAGETTNQRAKECHTSSQTPYITNSLSHNGEEGVKYRVRRGLNIPLKESLCHAKPEPIQILVTIGFSQ